MQHVSHGPRETELYQYPVLTVVFTATLPQIVNKNKQLIIDD